jgi:hypothetical protein
LRLDRNSQKSRAVSEAARDFSRPSPRASVFPEHHRDRHLSGDMKN